MRTRINCFTVEKRLMIFLILIAMSGVFLMVSTGNKLGCIANLGRLV
jgi:hypothetical protein